VTPVSQIALDASCDFPRTYLEQHGVHIIPSHYVLKGLPEIDTGDVKFTQAFYSNPQKQQMTPLLAYGANETATVAQSIDRLIKSNINHLTILTASEHFSKMHVMIRDITFQNRDHIAAVRKNAGILSPIKIKVIDSNCILSGYGLVAYEAIRYTTEKALPPEQLSGVLARLSNRVDTFISVASYDAFKYLSTQFDLTSTFDQKLSWLQMKKLQMTGQSVNLLFTQKRFEFGEIHKDRPVATQQLFNEVLTRLKTGQYQPRINISMAASRSEIRTHQVLNQFISDAQRLGAKVTVNMMSVSGVAMVGRNAISVSAIKV